MYDSSLHHIYRFLLYTTNHFLIQSHHQLSLLRISLLALPCSSHCVQFRTINTTAHIDRIRPVLFLHAIENYSYLQNSQHLLSTTAPTRIVLISVLQKWLLAESNVTGHVNPKNSKSTKLFRKWQRRTLQTFHELLPCFLQTFIF